MNQFFLTSLFSLIISLKTFSQNPDVLYMTGEVQSITKDNILTIKYAAGDIPGTKDSLDINKVIDLSTISPNMKGEMTIGVAKGFFKSKVGETVTIKINKYTSQVDGDHIVKVGNKLKIGWNPQ